MNKPEFVNAIADRMGSTKKTAELFVETFWEVVTDELASGGNVRMVGFGNFEVVNRENRIGRNPKTGVEIGIPARKVPKFKAGKILKDAVNE